MSQSHAPSNHRGPADGGTDQDFARSAHSALHESSATKRITLLAFACQRYLVDHGAVHVVDGEPLWIARTGHAYADSPHLHSVLARAAQLASTAPEVAAAVKSAIRDMCADPAASVGKVLRLSAVGTDGRCYVRVSDTHMVRVRDGSHHINGTAGLVIKGRDGFEDVGPLPLPSDTPLLPVAKELASYQATNVNDATGWLLALHLAYMAAPREAVRARPILALIGPAGTGKSTIARAMLRALLGRGADVMTPPDGTRQRDFQVALDGVAVVAIDDPDPECGWLAPLLRAMTTSATVTVRRLYTDRELLKLDTSASLIVTANALPVPPTPADVSRLVPITLEARADGVLPDGEVEDRMIAMRPQLFADLVELLRVAEEARWGEGVVSSRRLSRWEAVMTSMARRLSQDASWLGRALDGVERTRHELVLADDELASALIGMCNGTSLTSSAILEKLRYPEGRRDDGRENGDGYSPTGRRDIAWDATTPQAIGRRLGQIAESLRVVHGVEVEQAPRTGTRRGWIVRRVR
jgi:hypothetical protein